MSLNFNVDPYYDDFDPSKNFHRILYKPGYAVQARELTQSQTILQDQITKFADNIFKQNSPVNGGQITTNLNCYYIKLQPTYNNSVIDVTKFLNKSIQDSTGDIVAKVIAIASATTDVSGNIIDPDTLIVIYKSGKQFTDNTTIYDSLSNLAVQTIVSDSTGLSSVVSISQGVFYISSNYTRYDGIKISNGTFVQVNPQTIILSKYNNNPSVRVGLNISESIVDYNDDTSLLDPAIGASNYQAPGADRYSITLTLQTRPITLGDDDGFIELVRITEGNVAKLTDDSVYSVIGDYFAKRDYETNGDYIVNDFKLTPKANTADSSNNTYIMSVGKGLAYVHGYRVENPIQQDLISNRARTSATQNNNPIFMDFGSYFYVDTVRGNGGSFFDISGSQQIDLHCVTVANANTTNANTYNSTVVGSGYIRSLVYSHNTSDTNANTFVYKAYVNDIQLNTISANAVSGTANTIVLPSTLTSNVDNAYVGVNITITGGTSAGDFRTITSYVGSTRTATVNQNWTVTPTSSSVFSLNFDIADVETVISATKTSYPAALTSFANINIGSKSGGVTSGDVTLQNPGVPEMVFKVGTPYISSISDTSYTSIQTNRNVGFTTTGSGVSAQLNYANNYTGIIKHFGSGGSTLSSDLIRQNYTIVVTNKGSNASINVGDIIPWTTAPRSITLDNDSSIATLTATDLTPFTANIIEKVYISNADNTSIVLKGKNLIKSNTSTVNISGTQVNTYTFVDDTPLTSTGQVYIQNGGVVSSGNKQSLYLSDVRNIVKIIDTKSGGTVPTVPMLTNPTHDVTNNYIFDNGQRDNYYDHASITLKPGAPKPTGNLLVLLNYYQHVGGDGYFSVRSYISNGVSSLPEDYKLIPSYISKHGTVYPLRDSIDFRPARLNAQSNFVFRYANSGDNRSSIFLPVELTVFNSDVSYYLGRKDLLVLTKDRKFNIIEGSPSLNPIFPSSPDASLVVAQISHAPYTSYLPTETPVGYPASLTVSNVQHKRYTMKDIAGLESRINQVEYYTSLNLLEQSATSLQIPDAFGLNRFKNGIMTDDFSSYATADTQNNDYFASINKRTKQMSASQVVNNFPLKSLSTVYSMGLLSESTSSSLGYAINNDGYVNYFSLPFTSNTVFKQPIASRQVNINPFAYPNSVGTTTLSPNVDTWVDNTKAPALLITDPNLNVYRASDTVSVLSVGDWQTVSGTTFLSGQSTSSSFSGGENITNHTAADWGFGAGVGVTRGTTTSTTTSTFTTISNQQQTNILGYYSSIGNTYSLNNGYITDISIMPWIRPQQVVVRSNGLLLKTPVHTYFDGTNVDNYVRKCSTIELSGVSGTFNEDDVIGYYTGGIFYPTARIVGIYNYTGTSNTRLYVAGDGQSSVYTNNSVIQNAFFNTNGQYQSSTASGVLTSYSHKGGQITLSNNSTQIKLSSLASSIDNYYTGNTIFINSGVGVGQSSVITNYNGTTKTANLSSSITTSVGDIYSLANLSSGIFTTNESGNFYGIFNIPSNVFHTGQRIFRVDNSVNNNKDTASTYAEGTFYAEGLSTKSQEIDFGASPAGAKNTFTQTNSRTVVSTFSVSSTNSWASSSPWDPVAQTFIIDKSNYPNGIFLSSINVFFASKPETDNAPVTLSIVGTLNGYPDGNTLDHSVVTVPKDRINVSLTPHYLDESSYTTFKFSAPVYIQPGILYAFILKSSSNEYNMWTASFGDTAVASSVKNLPTDATPTVITKISSAPYVGGLFISQNSQTWTVDQNQSLMFSANQCIFDINQSPSIQFVVPRSLPQRTLIDQSIEYFNNSNTLTSNTNSISTENVYVDAFNISTTDFIPTTSSINYSYNCSLLNGSSSGTTYVNPGKYGSTMYDNIYLNDGLGERVLNANSNTSFSLYAQLSSQDKYVSPIISDAGLSTYAIRWNINNCELSNNLITLVSGGTGYSVSNTVVTVSSPTGSGGSQAYASANIVGGVINSVYFTNVGSGYITTPTITITDASTRSGNSNASVTIVGETSARGGNALAKYVTKKVVLNAGFDSGDLNVYMTAYRPVNTDILVYYKILNRNDTQSFDDSQWQLMTKINNSGTVYSQSRNDLYEYSFAPGTAGLSQGYVTYTSNNNRQTYTSFSQFAIKVVLVSTDSTYTPFLTDLRCIALPPNVKTVF